MHANCRALAKNPTCVSMLTSYTIRTTAAVSIYKLLLDLVYQSVFLHQTRQLIYAGACEGQSRRRFLSELRAGHR